MKKIKISITKDGIYCIELNDGNKENVVYECDTIEEYREYMESLSNPPEYIVMGADIVAMEDRISPEMKEKVAKSKETCTNAQMLFLNPYGKVEENNNQNN